MILKSHTHTHIYIYIYVCVCVVPSISFQTYFLQAFKIVVDSWKLSMLLLYILWDDWPIFMISRSNQQLQQKLEYTLLMMRGVRGIRKSILQSWLAKGLGLGLLCWGFKGVQEEIRSEEASTLQIGSVAFPARQCTSPQLHPHRRLFDQDGHHPPYSPDFAPSDFWLFPKLRGCRYEIIEEMKEAVMKVIDTLTQEHFHGAFQKLLEQYNKCIAAGGDYFEED